MKLFYCFRKFLEYHFGIWQFPARGKHCHLCQRLLGCDSFI